MGIKNTWAPFDDRLMASMGNSAVNTCPFDPVPGIVIITCCPGVSGMADVILAPMVVGFPEESNEVITIDQPLRSIV